MKISAKGRYGLYAMVYLAIHNTAGTYIPVVHIADALGISKIYLEQTFSVLKRAGLVISVKGAQGGYALSRPAEEIDIFDILSCMETSLLEKNNALCDETTFGIENTVIQTVFEPLDRSICAFLESISLAGLASSAEKSIKESGFMYFI